MRAVPAGPLDPWLAVLGWTEAELAAWGLAWARVLPAVLIVPAFGLRAVPLPVRFVFGFVLAAAVAPALAPTAVRSEPWLVELIGELLRGFPIAISAAVALWAATMAGGLVDELRGAPRARPGGAVESGATPLAALFGVFAAIAFLELGGASTLASRLAAARDAAPLSGVVGVLVSGFARARAIAAPLFALSVLMVVVRALLARAAAPATLAGFLPALRAIVILAGVGLVLDRIAELIVTVAVGAP
jgi:type III secretory pathway component EscT